jgi:hypothetical protein
MGSIPLLPEVACGKVDLVRRRVLGGPGDYRVPGQISIGRSEAVRLTPDTVVLDAELARVLARDADEHDYYLVLLNCTFCRSGTESWPTSSP